MRLLHLTDTHLGFVRPVQRPTDASPRRDLLQREAEHAFRTAIAPALHGEVDAVVHTGDVFDRSRPPRQALLFAAELLVLAARRVPVIVMAGNHDRRGLLRYLPMSAPNLHVVDRPTRLQVGGVAFGVVPFERTAAGFAVAARMVAEPGIDLLLAHQAFHGHRVPTAFARSREAGFPAAPGAGTERDRPSRWFTFRCGAQDDTIGAQHMPRGVKWVLCGHLHPRQVVQAGEATVVCPGSTVRTSFAERGTEKGVAIWTLGRTVGWQFTDIRSRPMHLVASEAELPRVSPGDLVRVGRVGSSERAEELARAALARGGWLVGRPAARRPAQVHSPPASVASPAEQLSLL